MPQQPLFSIHRVQSLPLAAVNMLGHRPDGFLTPVVGLMALLAAIITSLAPPAAGKDSAGPKTVTIDSAERVETWRLAKKKKKVDAKKLAPVTDHAWPNNGALKGFHLVSHSDQGLNIFYLEGLETIILFDTMWGNHDAEKLLGKLKKATRKPIEAVFITQPMPDHVGGLDAVMHAFPKAKTYGHRVTRRILKHDEQGFLAHAHSRFGDDFPTGDFAPKNELATREALYLAGYNIVSMTYPATAAPVSTVYYISEERALLTGDMVTSLTTPVLYQGNIQQWIANLRDLSKRFKGARTIHPGHGEPGPAKFLINEQLRYLATFRTLIEKSLEAHGKVTESDRMEIVLEMERRFPEYRSNGGFKQRKDLIAKNIDWVLASWHVKGSQTPAPTDFGPSDFGKGSDDDHHGEAHGKKTKKPDAKEHHDDDHH